MRISDWSSDVCSSDLLGEDAERLGECDLKLRGGESARVGDDLHIDIVGDVLPGGDGRLASGRRVRSKDAKPVDARRRLQLAERIQPPAAAPQRVERGCKLDRLGGGKIGDAFSKKDSGHHLVLRQAWRSEEHTSELQSLMRISYAVFCLKNKTKETQ